MRFNMNSNFYMAFLFNSRVLWNDSLFHSCLKILTHYMIAFYYILLNILKS